MKTKLSHFSCNGLCTIERNHNLHYIKNWYGHRSIHDPTVSDWLRIIYGKFIRMIPKKLNMKTLQIFDRGMFFLCFNPRFKIGEMV